MLERQKSPEEILDVNRRWLPPSPHVEKVVEYVLKGRATIQKRGHNEPPLFVFEDGGVLELPKVRYEDTYRGMQLVSSDGGAETGTTKHVDVCGCVDEIKGTLRDRPELVQGDPHVFDRLLDHALYMISRMAKREEAYRKFAADVIALCTNLPQAPDPKMSASAAEEMKSLLHGHPEDITKYADLLDRLAEDVRHVASRQERCLAQYKKLAISIYALYREIQGARNWDKDENEATSPASPE